MPKQDLHEVDDYEDGEEVEEVEEVTEGMLPEDAETDSHHWLVEPVRIDASSMPWNYRLRGKKMVKRIQKGRWIKILPVESGETDMLIGEVQAYAAAAQDESKPEAVRAEMASKAVEATKRLKAEFSKLIPDWNLIDWDGKLLPKPYKNPAVIHGMPSDAVAWLGNQIRMVIYGADEDDADRPNAGSSSRSRSPAAGRRR